MSPLLQKHKIITCIKPYIAEWRPYAGGYVIKTQNLSFNELLIYKHAMGMVEKTLVFLASTKIVSPKDMSPKAKKLYKKLKNMETELTWKGVLKRQPFFWHYTGLTTLQKRVESVKFDASLANLLNSDAELRAKLLKSMPNEVKVVFSGGLASPSGEHRDYKTAILEEHVRLYHNPTEITLLNQVKKMPSSSLFTQCNVIVSVVMLLDILVKREKELVDGIANQALR